MGKRCTYTYYDEFGNLSEDYYTNESELGEEAAEALFISKYLKQDINIRFSKKTDVRSDLRNRVAHGLMDNVDYGLEYPILSILIILKLSNYQFTTIKND